MHNYLRKIIGGLSFPAGAVLTGNQVKILSEEIAKSIETQEFAELYAPRTGSSLPPQAACCMGSQFIEKWRITMTALTDAMTAVGAIIAQNKVAIDPAHVKAIDDGIAALQAHASAEDAEILDVTNAMTALSTAAAGTAGAGTDTGESSGSGTAGDTTGTGGKAA